MSDDKDGRKILVAEDEYYIRKSIIKILKNSSLDIRTVYEAENGKQAIGILSREPDIGLVITDIRMDGIDGIELAEYIRDHLKDTAVIILTAYLDFSFAQKAIRCQVMDYITKPVFAENLLPVVKRVLEEREEKKKEQDDIRKQYIQEIGRTYASVKSILEHRELLEQYMPAKFINPNAYFRIFVIQQEDQVEDQDIRTMEQFLANDSFGIVKNLFFSKMREEYIVLVCADEKTDLESGRLDRFLRAMISYFSTCKRCSLTVGIGRTYRKVDEIYRSYKEAVYAVNQRLLDGWNRSYFYDRVTRQEHSHRVVFENELIQALRTQDRETADRVIHDSIYKVVEGDRNIQALYLIIADILRVFNTHFTELGGENKEYEDTDDIRIMSFEYYDLYGFKHLHEAESYLKDIVKIMCSRKEDALGKNKIIQDIICYLENNFSSDISLKELAEKKYFMNYSYLSRLFGQETGKTFSRYLIEYRLNKAKELLKNESVKISHIAYEVGYNDVSYFISSFKKVYGVTPEEFRNRHLSGEE